MSKNYDVSQGQNVQNYRKVNGQAKKAAQSNTTKPNSIMTKQTKKTNYSAYGLINNNGAGSKVKDKKGVEYTVIGQAVNGRTVVKDKKGQTQVLAHDGTLLKLSFAQQTAKTGGAKPKSASQTTLGSMKKNLISAKAAFQKQLDDDGWAGDVADGVSALWGSKNRASVIRKELAGEQDRLNQLAQAAQKGDANFKTKFKQIYGVEYNKQAVEAYNKKPNAANFKKAYGSKYPDIRARVNEYNKSQQEGAEVVKTSAKVTTGVAIGVATGGAGLVALGVAAGATTLASAGVEYSDRYKWTGGGGLRKGTSHKKIWKGAAWDGLSVAAGGAVGKIATTAVKGTTMAAKVGRGAINVAGDTGVGAAQEYSETGKVTVTGVVTNATMGGVGSAVTSGVLKEAKAKIVRNFSSKTKKSTATPAKTSPPTKQIPTTTSETLPKTVKNTETFLASTKSVSNLETTSSLEAPLAGGGVFTSSSGGGLFSKIKSKLGFNTKIEPEIKDKLKANYMDDIIQTVEANDNMHVSQRLKETLNGKPLVTELDSPASLKDISSHVGNGDVCSVGSGNNQKLYVNDNGTPIELKISKEKLEELFPPLETATFNQPGGTKVCTILSKINTMLDTPSGRTKIYTMLEQDGNDIIVNLRGGRAPVRFTGGKPVNINLKDNGYRLISGNAQGVEMLEQAVLVDRIRQIEDNLDTVNITDFSVQKIIKRAGKEAADNTASIPLLGKAGALKMTPQGISKTIQNDYEPGTDMLTALWEGHARSVVGYDATTKIVTYHDPLKGGVDIQEPLETFLSHNGLTINLNKATPTTVNRTQHNSTTAQAEVHSATPKKDKIEQTKTEQPNVQNDTSTSFVSKTTDLVQGKTFVIARTTDGIPIGATVTQSNVIIKKSGKYVSIDIPKRGSYEAIQENSSGNFLIVKTDMNGKVSVVTSETPELPNVSVPPRTDNSVLKDSKVPSKDVNTSRVSISSQAKTKAPLEIPTGAQFVDTVVIAGKSRRRIKMPDGSIRTEYNGRWQNF